MEEFIEQALQECTAKNITEEKKIFNYIFKSVWNSYKGKAPKWKVQAICEDIAESVYLRMHTNN